MRYLFFIVLSISSMLLASTSKEIYIELDKEMTLEPIYIFPVKRENTPFSENYGKALDTVLSFDFDHNGRTTLEKKFPKDINLEKNFIWDYRDEWLKLGIAYVVRPYIKGSSYGVEIFDVRNNTGKELTGIELIGELDKDRGLLHQIADTIHLEFFQIEGICSTKLLFTIRERNTDANSSMAWRSEVYECDYDGANMRQVTRDNHYAVSPKYFPPKEGFRSGSFFYVSYLAGMPKIYVSSLENSAPKRFSYLRGNQLMPEIAIDREQVAFINDAPGNPEVFIQRFNPSAGAIGKPRQIFSCRTATQATPSFSPDGRYIAFVSDKSGSPRIYIMDLLHEGEKQIELISKQNRENAGPAWSPDGSMIAYSSRIDGIRQIWIYDCASKKERQLTFGPGNKENPTWAPDSLHLAFNSADRQYSELYIVNLHQPRAIKISRGAGEKRFPSWEPKYLK